MNETRRISDRHSGLTGLLILTIGGLCLAVAPGAFAQYEGPEFCTECHLENYADWSASGHKFKLMHSDQARNRPIPLPEGYTWDDISYVIGGHKWKARYMDQNGYIITEAPPGTPGNNQFNFLTGTWSDYNAGVVEKPYDCGRCHTTGWVADDDAATDGTLEDNQDGLPGIHGTFFAGGIQCEACHGPGITMEIDNSAAFCGTCHVRGESNTIPASGGFIRHHEQYNELLASPHRNMDCVSCHNPHKSSEWSIKEGRACEDCHGPQASQFATTNMSAVGVECIDCHMAKATKSAQALGPYEGDVWTHLFRINTEADYEMFNQAGDFVNLDSGGNGFLNVEFACLRCHGNKTDAWAEEYATNFHSTDFRITGGISGTWWGGPDRDGEGWLIDMANAFVAAFYTYNNVGDAAWLLGVGIPDGNTVTVTLEIQDPMGQGPSFGADYNAALKNTVPFGTATFTFTSCTMGEVTITPNAEMIAQGYEEITIPISRLTTPEISCPGTG